MSAFAPHLIGNRRAKEILSAMFARGAVPQVLLFYGPEGVGKSRFAEVAARHLLATKKESPPDLHIGRPTGSPPAHPAEQIRALIEEASLPPFEAPVKVFIIEEAEKMLPTSSNPLLKLLEEPPEKSYFILLTSAPEAMLPTTVSRCIKVPFAPIPEGELAQLLVKRDGLSLAEAQRVAVLSGGSLSRAERFRERKWAEFASRLMKAQGPTEFFHVLAALKEKEEADESIQAEVILEEVLHWIRAERPEELPRMVQRLALLYPALQHHVKLKTVLERLCLST
jgi:DNA polymerase-3 subunit delta'